MERRPQRAVVPLDPTDEEKQRHLLAHLPFADWCEHCQATRSKDHERHEHGEQVCPTVALGYVTTSTTTCKESPEVKRLVAVGNWLKATLAVPINAKGNASLKLCANAVCGCVKAVSDARKLLKPQTTQEFSLQGRSAPNPAERAFQMVRSEKVGQHFAGNHPCWMWNRASRFTPAGAMPMQPGGARGSM